MRQKRYTAPQIVFALQQADGTTPVAELPSPSGGPRTSR